MLRDRNLRNNAIYEANFAPEMYCDNYSRALERERIEELDKQARLAANKAMSDSWLAKQDPINAKPKKPTKGRKSLNKRDKLH